MLSVLLLWESHYGNRIRIPYFDFQTSGTVFRFLWCKKHGSVTEKRFPKFENQTRGAEFQWNRRFQTNLKLIEKQEKLSFGTISFAFFLLKGGVKKGGRAWHLLNTLLPTRDITPKCVTSGGAHLCGLVTAQPNSEETVPTAEPLPTLYSIWPFGEPNPRAVSPTSRSF